MPITLHRAAPAIPVTAMLHAFMVPRMKSFRDVVSDLDEQLSTAMLSESESKVFALLIDYADMHATTTSLRLLAKRLFCALVLALF